MNSSIEDLAVVAVSGGMDSCVTAAIANEKYRLAFAHINYGQRTEKRELKAFKDIADYFNVKERLIIDYTHLSKIGGSSLTDIDIPVSKADLNNERNLSAGRQVPTSYVPFRNANILSACVSWAEVLNAKAVFIGAVYEDSSGYPDCRPEYLEAFQHLANLAAKSAVEGKGEIRIHAPLMNMTKADIIRTGHEAGVDFSLTHSCYDPAPEGSACGECDSCILRRQGFKKAGIPDPTWYAAKKRKSKRS